MRERLNRICAGQAQMRLPVDTSLRSSGNGGEVETRVSSSDDNVDSRPKALVEERCLGR